MAKQDTGKRVIITPEQHRRVKTAASAHGQTLQQFIARLLDIGLAEYKRYNGPTVSEIRGDCDPIDGEGICTS